jgi:hypothetical protein
MVDAEISEKNEDINEEPNPSISGAISVLKNSSEEAEIIRCLEGLIADLKSMYLFAL